MLNKAKRQAVRQRITRCVKSGQAEAISVGNHLEGIYEAEDMTTERLLSSLDELEASAQSMRRELQMALDRIHDCVRGCEFIDGEDGNLCAECKQTFCDNCYDTSRGTGCKCHGTP